jgi:hypothetical protein
VQPAEADETASGKAELAPEKNGILVKQINPYWNDECKCCIFATALAF